jgi:hypothetical protein
MNRGREVLPSISPSFGSSHGCSMLLVRVFVITPDYLGLGANFRTTWITPLLEMLVRRADLGVSADAHQDGRENRQGSHPMYGSLGTELIPGGNLSNSYSDVTLPRDRHFGDGSAKMRVRAVHRIDEKP